MGTAMCSIAQIDGVNSTLLPDPTQSCGQDPCTGACKRLAAARALLEVEPVKAEPQFPIAIPDAFAADILKPYRQNATYLKSAEITHVNDKAAAVLGADQRLIVGKGRFAIPESCYIDDTGHFNAVEFNICFNQLAYVLFAGCINANVLHKVRAGAVEIPSMAEFKHHQLPAMMIVSLESRYFKPLNSKDFAAELSINKISAVGNAWFFFTSITFSDGDGVKAKGAVTLAFSPSYNPSTVH
jgi:(3R)-3-[(carboxylmethyl)amino]fatty acid synthase